MFFVAVLIFDILVAVAVSYTVVRFFTGPSRRLLDRVLAEGVADVYLRFIKFALLVVGVTRGVVIPRRQSLVNPENASAQVLDLYFGNSRGEALSVVKTLIIEFFSTVWRTLNAQLQLLLVVFAVLLVAYGVVRAVELWQRRTEPRSVEAETGEG